MKKNVNHVSFTLLTIKHLTCLLLIAGIIFPCFVAAQEDSVAQIDLSPSFVIITPNTSVDFKVMNVRISGPDREMILDTASFGDMVSWSPSTEYSDGHYNYDVVVVVETADKKAEDPNVEDNGEAIVNDAVAGRMNGGFVLKDGLIVVPKSINSKENNRQSFWKGLIDGSAKLAAIAVNVIVPSAEAADTVIDDVSPEIFFDDSQDEDFTPGWDWEILAEGGVNNADTNNYFVIRGFGDAAGVGTAQIFRLNYSGNIGAASSINSFIAEANGDIRLADSTVFIDKSLPFMGIGTTAPIGNDNFTISDTDPQLGLRDETDNTAMNIEYDSGYMEVENGSGTALVRIQRTTGNVAIGGSHIPTEKLHVRQSGSITAGDGLSKPVLLSANNTSVLPDDTSDVGFALKNERGAFQWNFRTIEGTEGFAATKEATGGTEFALHNPTMDYHNVSLTMGNGASCTSTGQWLNASSRDYKENIQEISAQEALDTLKQLNPVKYNFKKDAAKDLNVGFIAEDVPELVATQDRKTISPIEMVAVLTKAVQEQQKVVQEQQELIQMLSNKIDNLTKK